MRHNSVKSTTAPPGTPVAQRQLSVDSHKTQQLVQDEAAKRLSGNAANRQSLKCDVDGRETATAGGAGDSNKNTPGMEESCLLGIDCNERTTIGLVVPILADTTIHLDGDGWVSNCGIQFNHC